MDIPGSLHGACTRSQALAALGRYGLRRAVATGRLAPLWRGVLVDQGRLLDPLTRAAAACIVIGPTAVVCGPTALRVHGVLAAESATVHVATPYDRWSRCHDGLRVPQGRLPASDLVTVFGLPVVPLDLAVSDVLCTAPPRLALACADQAVALWRLDLAWPQVRVALEYDGVASHAGRERRDAARDDDLRRRGWLVVRATAADLVDPSRVLRELTTAFVERGGVLGSLPCGRLA